MLESSSTRLNAATMGLVMSLANPHNANKEVIRIKGSNSFLGTSSAWVLIRLYLSECSHRQQKYAVR